jgi:two-component system chemotaxis sensor kinase CheA
VDQAQNEFLIEIEQLVEQVSADLDELRQNRADGRVSRRLIDQIFRHVHSVKGSAASSGLDSLNQIAHQFENLLDAIRAGRTLLDDDVLDTCESATNALGESLTLAASGIAEPARGNLFEQLRAAAESGTGNTGNPGTDSEAILKTIPFEIWETLTDAEKHRLVSIVEEGTPLFVVVARFDLASFDAEFFCFKENLADYGEIISTSPAVDDKHPEKIMFRVVYASPTKAQDLEARVIGFSDVSFSEVVPPGHSRFGNNSEPAPSTAPGTTSLASLSNFVRADLDKLDRVISSTHELFRMTANALDLAMAQAPAATSTEEELGKLQRKIRNSFKALEADLINLRMVSLGPTLERAARAGRAAARLSGKDIDFDVVGTELRIDKLLADAIADPLIHLVRNAVDHGIEDTEARARAGKKRRGLIRIEALSDGSQSRVFVADDGCGIDPMLVSDAAKRMGIVDPDSTPDFERSIRLIFRPGFTTLASLSDISGRGVGLDVVETAVEQVGGELRVSSALERGTTFEIRLPVTFGLLSATVFVSGANRYCIPASQAAAVEVVDEIATTRGKKGKEITFGTDHLPLVSMRELLGQPEEPDENGMRQQSHLVIVQLPHERAGGKSVNGTKMIALLVDAVEGTKEVLVRNLGRHAGRWYGVAGATELRDGTVALVLDLPRLLKAPFVL